MCSQTGRAYKQAVLLLIDACLLEQLKYSRTKAAKLKIGEPEDDWRRVEEYFIDKSFTSSILATYNSLYRIQKAPSDQIGVRPPSNTSVMAVAVRDERFIGHMNSPHKCTSQSYCVTIKSRNGFVQRSCDDKGNKRVSQG
ncbi:hypothetical protein DICVIV_07616 [Dictyocaulus viviparus]|uniref:Uncharacterized protein n=1 Tax=Dictyocaulus viviparus TaxID=29172 RepID=A0A0D8XVD2_DICVI|nr:hypothetical protein DICVIV_07616 [Dictyocaulus viviparus]